jgi:hypothetical protein
MVALLALAVAPVSAGVIPACDTPGNGNLVSNCGFETGDFTGWTLDGTLGSSAVDASNPDNGTYEAYFGEVGNDATLSQTINGNGTDTLYSLVFALAGAGGTPNDFTVLWNGIDVGPGIVNLNPSFPYIAFSGILSGSSTTNTLTFQARQDPNFWYLDDVTLVPLASGIPQDITSSDLPSGAPEPGTAGLLLIGLGLLVPAIRRLN